MNTYFVRYLKKKAKKDIFKNEIAPNIFAANNFEEFTNAVGEGFEKNILTKKYALDSARRYIGELDKKLNNV